MFALPLVRELHEYAKLAGICDISLHRAKLLSEECGGNIPCFSDFDTMLQVCQPDAVIVTTIDSMHHAYIIRGLEAGCDVITEKPMTIDADKCMEILEAERKSGKKVIVTFNARYVPYALKIKQLLREGIIGDIQSVHLEWFLDQKHGADYFRRWHRNMENSGGLLLHKATHHFDMVNWWLADEPEKLHAFGDLRFFGPRRPNRGQRCLTCEHQNTCGFFFNIQAHELTRKLYYDAEQERADGYIRDQCVFGEDIDIYDTMSVNVKYKKGTYLSYSLTAYNPMEGWKASLVGTEGRMELEYRFSGPKSKAATNQIHIYKAGSGMETVEVKQETGSHGGGDARLRRMVFVGDIADAMNQQADSWAGAMSLMIGAAANASIREGQPIVIRDLWPAVEHDSSIAK